MYRLCGVLTLTLMALAATEASAFDFSSAADAAKNAAKNAAVSAVKGQVIPVDCAKFKNAIARKDGDVYLYSIDKPYSADARLESVTVDGQEFPVTFRDTNRTFHDKGGEHWWASTVQIKVWTPKPAKTMVFKFGANACTMDFPAAKGKTAKLPAGVIRQ